MSSSKTGVGSSHKPKEWHSLSVPDVLKSLNTTTDGLNEEQVEKRRTEYGLNTFTETKRDSVFSRILSQLKSPLTIVLLLAFFITLGIESYLDAAVIFFALLVAVSLGVLQEGKASKAFESWLIHRLVWRQ